MADAGDTTSSPSSSRAACSPWSHIVRGQNGHSTAAACDPPSPSANPIASHDPLERSVQKSSVDGQPKTSDHVGDGNAATSRGKKPAWNMPSSSGATEGVIMDAENWPALSDSARTSQKSSSDSLKNLSGGSVAGHLGSASPNPKSASSNTSPNLTLSPSSSSTHNPMKRGTNSGAVYGGVDVPSPLPFSSQTNQPLSDKRSPPETSSKPSPNKYTNNNDRRDRASKVGAVSPQLRGVNDQRSYGGSRMGNNGHHNRYVNRWDPECRSSEWIHQNFVRDAHMQQLPPAWSVHPYPPPPFAAQLVSPPPPPMPFSNNFGFVDFSPPVCYVPTLPTHHPEPLRGVSFNPHPVHSPPMMFYPTSDQHRTMLLKQIEYYFSPENLCKDTYLRQNMDEQGWVPISLIAGFNRVKHLTNNIQFIIDTMQLSNVVEVQGDKIRKRNGWMTWVLNTSNHLSTAELRSPASDIEGDLAAQLRGFGLEKTSDSSNLTGSAHTETALNP